MCNSSIREAFFRVTLGLLIRNLREVLCLYNGKTFSMYKAPSRFSIRFLASILKTTAATSATEQPQKKPEEKSYCKTTDFNLRSRYLKKLYVK